MILERDKLRKGTERNRRVRERAREEEVQVEQDKGDARKGKIGDGERKVETNGQWESGRKRMQMGETKGTVEKYKGRMHI